MRHLGTNAATPLTDTEMAALHSAADDTCIMPVPADAEAPPQTKLKGRKADRQFIYRDANGNVLGHVLRWEARDGRRKEFRPLTFWSNGDGRSGWKTKAWPSKRPLFGLDQLAKYRVRLFCWLKEKRRSRPSATGRSPRRSCGPRPR
jgi:hypothetical protein